MVLSLRLLVSAGLACAVCLGAADLPLNGTAYQGNTEGSDGRIPSSKVATEELAESARAQALVNALKADERGGFRANIPSSILGGISAAKNSECAIPLTTIRSPGNVEFIPETPRAKPSVKAEQPKVMHNFDRIGIKPTAPSCSELHATAMPEQTKKQR